MAIVTENLRTDQSEEWYQQAIKIIPGGVNSPVRAFNAVGGNPLFIQSAKGAYLRDVDGNSYIDYVDSWGTAILGHAHPNVVKAVQNACEEGLSFGAPSPREVALANTVCKIMPSIEQIRFVNSGTEATMTALRLARGYTQKSKIIKFVGCYHGHVDSLLIKAGSGALTFGQPNSAGVSKAVAAETLLANFNDIDSVAALFKAHKNEIAAVIIEPLAANMNLVIAEPAFIKGLRQLCDQEQSLLIFDEVISGFRVRLQGAQDLYQVRPDLTTLGKIIGGGMPIGAVGGRTEIMEFLAPTGPVYQAGTLSGNPIAMAAGLATLEEIQKPGIYEQLQQTTQQLIEGLRDRAKHYRTNLFAHHIGSLFGIFFTKEPSISNYEQVMQCDTDQFKKVFQSMLRQGVYLAPSAFESGFVSIMHTQKEITATLAAFEKAFAELQNR